MPSKTSRTQRKKSTKKKVIESSESSSESLIYDETSSSEYSSDSASASDSDSSTESSSSDDELANVKSIKMKKDGTDIREICFEDINENFQCCEYNGIKALIMRKNGYMNATKLCAQVSNRRFRDWLQNLQSQELIKATSRDTKIKPSNLTIVIQNGKHIIKGTYVHRLLIPHIASWASPDFGVKVSHIVNEYFIKQEKDKYDALLKEKDDKIDKLHIKMDKLLKGNKHLKLDNKQFKLDNENMRNRLDSIYEQNEHLEEQNDELGYKLDTISDKRVIPAKNNGNNHTLIIIENHDDPKEYKKGTNLYDFSAIRVANKSLEASVARHKKFHRHMKIIMQIDYSPNAMNLWTRIREKLERVSKRKRKINCNGRNFNLNNGFTKRNLLKAINQIHNERLNIIDV